MFQSSDIPFNDFQKLGKSKQDILELPDSELKALLSGRTTGLLNIKPEGAEISQAKISIYRLSDGSVDIKVHPIRDQIEFPTHLRPEQTQRLLQGEIIIAPESSKKDIKEKYMYQVDLETNEVIKTRIDNIRVPEFMEGNRINKEQREKLLDAQSISLNKTDGTTHYLQVDLTAQNGYKIYRKEEIHEHSKDKSKSLTHLVEKDNSKKRSYQSAQEKTKRSVNAGLTDGPNSISSEQSLKTGRKR